MWFVEGSPCATIQHAVNESSSGDTINLGPGKYVENVFVNQNVTIQGDSAKGSTLDGNQASSVFGIDRGITATLSMLTITNGNVSQAGGGIANDAR